MTPDYQKALAQLETEDFVAALESLDRVLSESPFAEAYFQRGRVRAKLQDFSGAIADYSEAIRLQPTAQAYLNRGVLHLTRGMVQAAIDDAQQAMQIDRQLALAPRLLGKAYTQLGNWSQAIVAYKQAAQCYLEQQDKENARYCIAQIESLQPLVKEINQAQLLPSNPPLAPAAAQDFLQQVNAKLDRGNASAALFDLNWLLNLEPDHLEALCLLAKVQAKLGNGQAAIDSIARAVAADPQNREVQFQRGMVRLLLGDAQGAIDDFTRLLSEDGSNVQLFTYRGQGYAQLGEFESAFKDYSNAIGISSENAALYFARAEAQNAMGDRDGAIGDYQQAAALWLNQNSWDGHQKAIKQADLLRGTTSKTASNVIRVPIKYRIGETPVIEATFNNQYTFDMALDAQSGRTIISPKMAYILRIQPSGRGGGRLADGQYIEFETGWVQSVAVRCASGAATPAAIVHNLEVIIASQDVDGLLGQDFLSKFHVRILNDEVEFHS